MKNLTYTTTISIEICVCMWAVLLNSFATQHSRIDILLIEAIVKLITFQFISCYDHSVKCTT